MISEDTHNKLLALGLHKDAFNNYFYKNHSESFIFTFEDLYCCIYDFTIKDTIDGLEIKHKSNVSIDDENKLVNLMKDVIKRYKEISIELKKRELENDFEPSMWSKFVNFVHKLLRNLWSLLHKQDTWYLIALFPLFGGLIYSGYKIFYMIYSFFTGL